MSNGQTMLKSWPLAKYAGRTKKNEYKDGSAAQVHIQRKTEENGGKSWRDWEGKFHEKLRANYAWYSPTRPIVAESLAKNTGDTRRMRNFIPHKRQRDKRTKAAGVGNSG